MSSHLTTEMDDENNFGRGGKEKLEVRSYYETD
jgi:hypothetical protein